MPRIRVLAALAGLGALLSACASQPSVPFDRSTAKVQTIGIVTPTFPDGPTVALASSVGRSFGLIGALVDAGMQANRESTFKDILAQQSFSAKERFLAKLTDDLRANGYNVEMVALPREGRDFAKSYPVGGGPKVDAYLDLVTTTYGYVAAGIGSSTPYRPLFAVRARLVSANGVAGAPGVLMQDAVVYNAMNPGAAQVVTVAPDQTTPQFKDFDALVADPQGAVTGLGSAVDRSAEAVGQLLH
jgi:hypothetical protein